MFAGIVQGSYSIQSIQGSSSFIRYRVLTDSNFIQGLSLGASVSVNGVCQSVVALDGNAIEFEAILETIQIARFDLLRPLEQVNLERSLRWGAEVGGHILSGHIVGQVKILNIDPSSSLGSVTWTLGCPKQWMPYLFYKGFVALHGASLTLGRVSDSESCFEVHLIPDTLARTNFNQMKLGMSLNLELDSQTQVIVDTIKRQWGVVLSNFNKEAGPRCSFVT